MQNTQDTPNRRAQTTQATVDRYAADPAAKAARSIALAQAHGLSARVARIERAADDECLYDALGAIVTVTYRVPSLSDPRYPHVVVYAAAYDSAQCDCPASLNGLPCGHAGAALTSARALLRGDAQRRAQREAAARDAAAWTAALDAMRTREAARRAAAHDREEDAILYRRPFSVWRSDLA